MFSLQNQCDVIVDHARTILSQLFWLQNYPLLSVTYKSDGFAKSSFHDEVQEHSMTFLIRLIPASFTRVPHSEIVCVFHELVKHPTIPEIDLKQYALANLRVIINALGAL